MINRAYLLFVGMRYDVQRAVITEKRIITVFILNDIGKR